MERNLLTHSMSEFSTITLPILALIQAKTIAEIGAEYEGNTMVLFEWLQQQQGQLITIDPLPSYAFSVWQDTVKETVTHIAETSLDAIAKIKNVDAWFVDGDHNWYTVFNELQAIHNITREQNRPLVIFLHNVSWPCARRDFYYAPERIPAGYCLPHTWEKGVHIDNAGVIEGGFRGHGEFAIAAKQGGPRNGVLTAVEDFIAEHPNTFHWAMVPGFFGLGVIYDCSHPQAEQINQILNPLHENAMLAKLEENYLSNYFAVLAASDAKVARNKSPEERRENEIATLLDHLLTVLNNGYDHPEVWNMLRYESHLEEMGDLPELIQYLDDYLLSTQDEAQLKTAGVLHAMCLAHTGEVLSALDKLEKLYLADNACALISGAIFHVQMMLQPIETKIELPEEAL